MGNNQVKSYNQENLFAIAIFAILAAAYILLPMQNSLQSAFMNIAVIVCAIIGGYIIAYNISSNQGASLACAIVYGLNPLLISLLHFNVQAALSFVAISFLAIPLTRKDRTTLFKSSYTLLILILLYACYAFVATAKCMDFLNMKTSYLLPLDAKLSLETTKSLYMPAFSNQAIAIGFYQIPTLILLVGFAKVIRDRNMRIISILAVLIFLACATITPPISAIVWAIPATLILCAIIALGYAKLNPSKWTALAFYTNIIICARLLCETLNS